MFNISAQQNGEFLQLSDNKNHAGLKAAKSNTDSFLAMVSNALMLNDNSDRVPKSLINGSNITPKDQTQLLTNKAMVDSENKLSLRELLTVKNSSKEQSFMHKNQISEELKSPGFGLTSIQTLTNENSNIKGSLRLLKILKRNPEPDLFENLSSLIVDKNIGNILTAPASLEQDFSAFLNTLNKSAQGTTAENMVHKKILKLGPEQKVQIFQILKTIEAQITKKLPDSNLTLINAKNEPAKIQIKNNNNTVEITAPLSVKKDMLKVMPFIKHLVRNGLERNIENVPVSKSKGFIQEVIKSDQKSNLKISNFHTLNDHLNKNSVDVKNQNLDKVKSHINPRIKESGNHNFQLPLKEATSATKSKINIGKSPSPKITKSNMDENIIFKKTGSPENQFNIDRRIPIKLFFVDQISINENKTKVFETTKTNKSALNNKVNSEVITTDKNELQNDKKISNIKIIKDQKSDLQFSHKGKSADPMLQEDSSKQVGSSMPEKVKLGDLKDNSGILAKQNQESSQHFDIPKKHNEQLSAIDRNTNGSQNTNDSGNKKEKQFAEIKLNTFSEQHKNADKSELFTHTLESVKTSFHTVPKTVPLVKEIPVIIQRYYDNQNQTFTQNKVVVDAGEMGKLDIRFNESTSTRSLLILVENESAKNEMQRLAPIITENLAGRGVHVSTLSIDIGHSGKKNEKHNSSKNNSQGTTHAGKTEGDNEKNTTLNTKRYYGYNSMDIVA